MKRIKLACEPSNSRISPTVQAGQNNAYTRINSPPINRRGFSGFSSSKFCHMAPKPTLNLEDLYDSIANIFDQAQVSLANHKKNCVALYKLHTKAAAITQPAKKGNGLRLVGEKAFQDVFVDMVNRVLVVKKGPANADRIVKYVGSYVMFMNEKGVIWFTLLLIFFFV